jgi:hypothetical protein
MMGGGLGIPCHASWRGMPGCGYHVPRLFLPRVTFTPPPYMAGFSAFAPPCMVAGPNELVLKKIEIQVKFKICFKFGLKIKKNHKLRVPCNFKKLNM